MADAAIPVPQSDVADLTRINLEMIEHERAGDDAARRFFEALLDDELQFRRGKGVTDRAGFLEGLGGYSKPDEVLTTEIHQVQVLGDQAFVEASVRLDGVRGGEHVVGTFRNLRLFERQSDAPAGWRLVMWFNRKLADTI